MYVGGAAAIALAYDTRRSTRDNPTPRVARSGVLILGGGFAGRYVAHALATIGVTVVEPAPTPQSSTWPNVELVPGRAVELDPERRVAQVDSRSGRLAIAYAQLVVAVGRFARSATRLGLPHDAQGRVRIDETLRVVGAPHIWALGDCAALPNGAPHDSAPTALATFYEGFARGRS